MEVTIQDVIRVIEAFAPLGLQEPYDNSGLQVGSPHAPLKGGVLCVDVTEAVLDEAIALGANLIVSHHPLLFHPLSQVVGANAEQRIVARALIAGVGIYSAHTNLDSAPQGLSFFLGRMLGLKNMQVLVPHLDKEGGYGVIGEPPQGEIATLDFLQHVQQTLSCRAIRHSALSPEIVTRVALSTGSGASFIPRAIDAGADLYMAADFKYNDFTLPDFRCVVADLGHFESEYCAIELLYDIITKKITTFAFHKSKQSINPVNYLL